MSQQKNYTFALAETWSIELACVDPDGQPVSLVNGAVEFRLANATAMLLDLRLAATADATFQSGKATLLITPADNGPIPAGLYQYETRAVLASGVVYDQLFGTLYARSSLFRTFPYTPPDTSSNDLDLTSGSSRLTAVL